MTDSELKKLSRKELLEIMIEQAEEIERLQAELKATEEKLQERELRINNVGSLAEAALQINGVFEAAQAAADQYLENIHNFETICKAMQEDSKQRAARIVEEAEAKAAAREEEAQKKVTHYWEDLSAKLEAFYADHKGLKELLAAGENEQ